MKQADKYAEKMAQIAEKHSKRREKAKGKKIPITDLVSAFGIIGWSVAAPILVGVFAGRYIDQKWPTQYSFTLMFIFAGAVYGCYNAWKWLKKKMGEKNGNKS